MAGFQWDLVLAATLPAAIVVGEHFLTRKSVKEVRDEVRTFNETTAGSLAAAGETRRIEAIPHDQRTPKEQRHLDTAPADEEPQGPAR